MFTYSDIFTEKQRILIVSAHPDDSIVFFGGLIAKLRQDKKDVHVLLVTNGARGSRENDISESDLAKMRLGEEANALGALGVPKENMYCLGHADGEVESDLKFIGEIAKYIRKLTVDIVCTHEPSNQYQASYDKTGYFVQHRDHRKVGEAVIDAVYPFSRDRSFFTEHYAEGIEPHSVYDILLTDEKASNFDFDVADVLEQKRSALREHKSQFDESSVEEVLNSFKDGDRFFEKFNYLHLKW